MAKAPGKRAITYALDRSGRRVGYMTPERFNILLASFYDSEKWIPMFCEDFDYSKPSVYRWLDGSTPIRRDIAMLVAILHKLGGRENLPILRTPWLDKARAQAEQVEQAG